jgi:hypothetical protein
MFSEAKYYYWLYINGGKVPLAALYRRRVRVDGRIFVAALVHISTVVKPPVPAEQNIHVDFWRPYRGQTCERRRETRQMYSGTGRCAEK